MWVAPVLPPTTTTTVSDGGSVVPLALKTSYASLASIFCWFGPPLASAELIPPMARLTRKRPIVAANHRPTTGKRWRALHIAIRTVSGSRPLVADEAEPPVSAGVDIRRSLPVIVLGWGESTGRYAERP